MAKIKLDKPRSRFSTEAKFSAWLRKELLASYPNMLVTNITGTGYGTDGVHDLLCCHHGCFVSMELKLDGKKLTPLQEHYAEKVTKAGGFAIAPLTPSKVPDLWRLLDLIADLARRNEHAAKQRYRDAVESMESVEAGEGVAADKVLTEATTREPEPE
jgi:hypothetical protein